MRLAVALQAQRPPADVLRALVAAGLPAAGLGEVDRPSLVTIGEVEWLLTTGADVITLCVRGAADAGFVGKEDLVEREGDLAELLDLGTARRRLVHAAPLDALPERRRLRLATCYPRTTRAHFGDGTREVEVILMGTHPWLAVEAGLAHGVVEFEDVLAAHAPWLASGELIAASTTRMVAGRQSRALNGARLAGLMDGLRRAREGA